MAGGGTAMAAGATVNDRRTGQFVTGRELTDQQREFVRNYILNGGIGSKAAEVAGYSAPGQRAWDLMKNPAILAAIREETSRILFAEVAVASVGLVLKVLRDEGARNSDRVQAARLGMEAAKLIKKDKAGDANPLTDKPLSDMTLAELETFITAGTKAVEAKAAGVIEGVSAQDSAPESDITDVTP